MNINEIYPTSKSGPLMITGRNKKKFKVMFLNTGYETEAHPQNIERGYVKDYTASVLYKIGSLGKLPNSFKVNNSISKNPLYIVFKHMIKEVKNGYATISPELSNLSVFYRLCESGHIDGYYDWLKDKSNYSFTRLAVNNKNNHYSKELVSFVPKDVYYKLRAIKKTKSK